MTLQDSQNPHSAKRALGHLIVWQWPTETSEPALAILQSLAAQNGISLTVCGRMDTAAAALQATPDAMLLLLVPTAHKELAVGMAAGQMPVALLVGWMSRARDVLDLRRTDRRRCLMITPEAVIFCPEVLCARLDLQPLSETPLPVPPEGDPVLELLAQHTLDSDAEARSLARELNASLLHPDPEGAGSALDSALLHYLQSKEAEELQSREAEELTEQLLTAQKEAETYYQRAEKLASLEAERDAALAETELFLTQLTVVQEACDQAEAQLRSVEDEHAAVVADKNAKLRGLSERKKKSDTERDTLHHRVEQLEQQKHQLAQGLESHQTLLQEAEAARQSLREQLAQMHDAHAELGNHLAGVASLEETLADREDSLAEAKSKAARFERQSRRLEDRVATLDHSLAAHQAHIADREARIAALDDRLGRILHSPGYRMTAPLRALFGRSSRDA